jgi:hypothetical protein
MFLFFRFSIEIVMILFFAIFVEILLVRMCESAMCASRTSDYYYK